MSNIFISYRRAESEGYVIAIYDRLLKYFTRDQIFRDIDTIDYGMNFVEVIEQAVGSCDVLLAVMGRQWASVTDSSGRRRLDNPNDFVRLEVATALRRNIRVIPVLVSGASMPYEDELPDDLKPLVYRNALEIDARDVDHHVDRLAGAIGRALEAEPRPVIESTPLQDKVESFDLMLVDTGRQKINVIKAIRSFTYLGLAEAKSLAESTPSAVLRGVSEAEATQAAQQLQNQGATVRLRESKTKPNHTAHIKEVDLALIDVGPNKINIIKVVRSLTGLGLAEAKSLVESVPAILLEKVELPAAEDAKRRLEAEGATVEIS